MVKSIYFLKPAWCGTHFAGLGPEQGLQPVTRATAFRRWFVTEQTQKKDVSELSANRGRSQPNGSRRETCLRSQTAFDFEILYALRVNTKPCFVGKNAPYYG
jgi:hypothetical protein